jgi:tetratricopeptide (TPR) repeat protein
MRLLVRSLCVLSIITLVAPLLSRAQEQNPEVVELFRKGAAAMGAGDVVHAETDFLNATRIAPSFAPAYLDLGLAQLKQGKLKEATLSIRKAISLDQNSPGAHMFLGIAEYQSNHVREAIDDLQAEISQAPDNAQALMWLGIVELSSGHPDKATGPLDRAAALNPNDLNTLDYRGQAHMAVAKSSYAQMYRLDPGSWRVHRLNAQIDAEAEQHDKAIAEYKAAIKTAPKEADLYEGLGEEYRSVGDLAQAQKAFEEQLELAPGNPVAMYNLGSVDVDRSEDSAGVLLLERVVKLYDKPTVADYYLGRGLAAESRFPESVKELQRATEVTGQVQMLAWYELGQVYRKMGKPDDAREALVKYQQLRQASESQKAKEAEDWRRLNAASEPASTAETEHSQN